MRTKPFITPFFSHDGRGPSLTRWIKDDELDLPGTHIREPHSNSLVGINYSFGDASIKDHWEAQKAWVYFCGLQVIQIIPEEVHSYWHLNFVSQNQKSERSGVWEIIESDWLKSFAQTHLLNHRHFVLEFYDDLVEVICRDLIFGLGDFDIKQAVNLDNRFAFAYFRRANSNKEKGPIDQVIADYELYLAKESTGTTADYVRRILASLRNRAEQ